MAGAGQRQWDMTLQVNLHLLVHPCLTRRYSFSREGAVIDVEVVFPREALRTNGLHERDQLLLLSTWVIVIKPLQDIYEL